MTYELFKKSIAISVKKQRKELGYSQRDLATRANVSQKTISNIENITSTSSYNIDVLFSIADALGLNVLDFFTDNTTHKELSKTSLEHARIYQQLPLDKQKLLSDTAKAFLVSKDGSGQNERVLPR